ncbi:amylosucrase [Olsenella profusa]|uniref:Amylosucrase n=1 Tax=Olsenella profusa TaxID=138595 RepID=A0ABS2F2T1_9ACTN|nr:amylosucrase [Olsenella profusa]MBM6775138.1 amylosucrase [Olsenella profusa]
MANKKTSARRTSGATAGAARSGAADVSRDSSAGAARSGTGRARGTDAPARPAGRHPLARAAAKASSDAVFQRHLARHHDELRWLYMELYDNGSMFAELLDRMKGFYDERPESLKRLDTQREAAGAWYRQRDLLGMQLYVDNFAGTLEGVGERLDYVERCHVNYLHLMPFLDTPSDRSRSDGGYAVRDFRSVRADLGTMADLSLLAEKCHRRGISLCMDFVMNHTSEEHDWARRARAGEGEYMSRYFFESNQAVIDQYTRDVPQVFPTTAPGHWTYLPELGQYVMTQFYPYQWDLNYRNLRVFNEMMYNFLYLANQGIDVMRLDAVPYIWKQLGTNCRNLPQVHTIVRMMRMVAEVVCPGVALLGEVVMAPVEVVPYFGTPEKPECHMLYNVTTMATTWHTVATRDTRLLRGQLESVCGLPKEYTFLNYLRCHDDIGWGLDYDALRAWGMEERPHKDYLNAYFQGHTPGSVSRGELYNADPMTGDARFCATTASMCGIEAAGFEGDKAAMEVAVRKDVMLHAYLLAQSGLPIIYSGDEVGQVNDYTYKDDPERADDSRYVHRGRFDWALVDNVRDKSTVQGKVFSALSRLEAVRRAEAVFDADAEAEVSDYSDPAILWITRRAGDQVLFAIYNFSDEEREVWMPGTVSCTDLMSGEKGERKRISLPAWGFAWLLV